MLNGAKKILAGLCISSFCVLSYAGAPSEGDSDSSNQLPATAKEAARSNDRGAVTDEKISRLSPFRVDYAARVSAFKGESSLELKPGDAPNEYIYEVTSKASGLARIVQSGTAVERSVFAMDDAGLRPLRYDYTEGSGKPADSSSIAFDWDNAVANSVHEGVAAELELTSGVQDRLTADLQSILELRAGLTPVKQNFAYKNSLRSYDMEFLEEETITVPAGTFETVKYRRHRRGSKRSTLIWFARDADFLPVRIEQLKDDSTTATMAAVKITS